MHKNVPRLGVLVVQQESKNENVAKCLALTRLPVILGCEFDRIS